MDIVSELNKLVSLHSGSQSQQKFLDRFMASPYKKALEYPLLTSKKVTLEIQQNLSKSVDYSKIMHMSIENPYDEPVTLQISEQFSHRVVDIESAFNIFIYSTAHTNAFGDFRSQADYYYPILMGMRYLTCHGDGNCVLLGILIQSFIKHFLNIDIDTYYSCGSKREFMHVYNRYVQHGEKYYLDADQKIHCYDSKLNQSYSPGLIFQLLGKAGFHAYEKMCVNSDSDSFYKMTHTLLNEFKLIPNAIIYDQHPDKNDFSNLFQQARIHSEERLDLYAEDYPWKKIYRDKAKESGHTGIPFMSQWDPIEQTLPANSILDIGLHPRHNSSKIPAIAYEFCKIFYGRIPARLLFKLDAKQTELIHLMEIPWLIQFENLNHQITISGESFSFEPSDTGSHIISMSDLEKVLKLSSYPFSLELRANSNTNIEIIFPINALAINSNLLQFTTNQESSCPVWISY